jgi:hypothetical protein
MILRAGYGIYYNTSAYQQIALSMAQQAPLSKSLSIANRVTTPLTLADAFNASSTATADTFAVDPQFRIGYAQNWQASLQRDLPGSLQMTATYLGIKGTHAVQEFLPNTFPAGAANPCPTCPIGFAYLTSGANSSRNAGELQLRRRLHSGLAATLTYTFSKSIDDAATLGGSPAANQANTGSAATPNGSSTGSFSTPNAGSAAPASGNSAGFLIAQNWRNLRAERSLSSFDQRHVLAVAAQYTSGIGLAGRTLLSGWRGAMFKEWTVATQVTAATGLPLTPFLLSALQNTGITGTVRPDYTGAPLYAAPVGLYLNPAAYAPPAAGNWGNAGRNSITGPAQFLLNASLGRTFRLNDRLNLDLRVDSTNALNHVTFTAWNTLVSSSQFGLPIATNPMRSMQTTLRVRF